MSRFKQCKGRENYLLLIWRFMPVELEYLFHHGFRMFFSVVQPLVITKAM